MAPTDKRVDAYIARSAAFARPVLTLLRKLVHRACPGAEETIKWGFPHFEHHGILCSMAAFSRHRAFGFRKARLLKDPAGALASSEEAMGQLGRITGKDDLPSDATLLRLIRQDARLNERGVPPIAGSISSEYPEPNAPNRTKNGSQRRSAGSPVDGAATGNLKQAGQSENLD